MNEAERAVDEAAQSSLALAPPGGDIVSVEDTVKRAEKYLDVMRRIRVAAIKLTNNLDWSNQGGEPYLEKSGCDKIAMGFGMRIAATEIEKETLKDDKGEYVMFTCSQSGVWNNSAASEIGVCSTRDDFFGTMKVDSRDASGKPIVENGKNVMEKGYKPLSEVDLTDVKKKAFTNCANRLIKKLLGLSFSWEEIVELSEGKITRETVARVDFKTGTRGGNIDSPDTKKKRAEIWAMILVLCDGEDNAARDWLVKATTFQGDNGPVPGKNSVEKLSEKQVERVYRQVAEATKAAKSAGSEDKGARVPETAQQGKATLEAAEPPASGQAGTDGSLAAAQQQSVSIADLRVAMLKEFSADPATADRFFRAKNWIGPEDGLPGMGDDHVRRWHKNRLELRTIYDAWRKNPRNGVGNGGSA